MLEMVNNPLMAIFDTDFLLYAGSSILSKTLLAFIGIWMACTLFDLVTDRETKPSRQRLLTRGVLAFAVPFVIIIMSEQAQTMPSSYRLYRPGSYEIGKSLPAGTYSVSSGGSDSTLTIKGEDGEISQQWDRGSMSVTVYDGDTLTLDGCSARNRTAALVYDANAGTYAVASGSMFLLGGAELRPGTYEITAVADDSEYELREGYLQADKPLDVQKVDGVAYADIHYGDVLYVKDATVTLYSNVFALSKEEATPDETGDGKKGDVADKATDDKKDDKSGEASDDKKDGAKEGETPEPATEGDAAKPEEAKPEEQGDAKEDAKDASPAPDQNQTEDDKQNKTVADLIQKVNQTPWVRGNYQPRDPSEDDSQNEPSAEDGKSLSFHEMVQRLAI